MTKTSLAVLSLAALLSIAPSAFADDQPVPGGSGATPPTPPPAGGSATPPPTPDDATLEQAKQLYDEGADAFTKGDFATAVSKLQRSYELVPSPNAELVLARALRETGNLMEAEKHFASCEAAAKERVAKGDDRFKDTASDAATEGAAVRAKLARVVVSAPGAKPGSVVKLDGKPLTLTGGSSESMFHDPGSVTVTLESPGEAPVTKTETLVAGKESTIAIEPAVVTPPPPTGGGRRKWAIPAAIASGGVAVIGAGLFIGFGVKSESIYSDFEGCAGHCPPAQFQDKASEGATAQNVANVSITIASVAAAASGVFLVLAFTDHSKAADDTKPTTAFGITPGGVALHGSF